MICKEDSVKKRTLWRSERIGLIFEYKKYSCIEWNWKRRCGKWNSLNSEISLRAVLDVRQYYPEIRSNFIMLHHSGTPLCVPFTNTAQCFFSFLQNNNEHVSRNIAVLTLKLCNVPSPDCCRVARTRKTPTQVLQEEKEARDSENRAISHRRVRY